MRTHKNINKYQTITEYTSIGILFEFPVALSFHYGDLFSGKSGFTQDPNDK